MIQNPYTYIAIKNRLKKYAIICNLIDKIIKRYNPCGIRLKGKKVVCKRGKPCCGGCAYLFPNGCSVNCLGCKLTFCHDLEYDKVTIKVMKLLKPLYVLAFLNNFIYIRSSKKEVLTQVNLTNNRSVKYRNIYNASAISYFPYKIDEKLIKWRRLNKQMEK